MKLSKINEEIIDLAKRANEIAEYDVHDDFNTRGGGYYNSDYIVANIKVYEWLDSSDVDKVIEDRVEHLREDIEEEFTDHRLNNIFQHTCEREVEYLSEQYEGLVHLENYRARSTAYRLWYEGVKEDAIPSYLKFYYEHYNDGFKKFYKRKRNTPKDYWKWLYKNNKPWIDERDKLELIEREVWQWGRSGGWLSLCKRTELENWEPDYYFTDEILSTNDNKEFNEYIWDEFAYDRNFNKREIIQNLKEFIRSWEAKFEAIQFFINRIEDSTKYFKDALVDRLNYEIEEFINDVCRDEPNVEVMLKGSQMKTTLGVSVNKYEFIAAYRRLQKELIRYEYDEVVPFMEKVGNYHTEYAKRVKDDVLVKAGCHWFSLNNVEEVINQKEL